MSSAITLGGRPAPPALIRAVAANAARSADRVVAFLDALGLGAGPDRPCFLPPEFLLAVGAGLQLLAWEAKGYTAHRDAGLPDARTVHRDAILSAADPGRLDPRLPVRVLAVFAERFAWDAPAAFGTDILLDGLDPDDAAAEAVAEFLWATRHAIAHDTPEG